MPSYDTSGATPVVQKDVTLVVAATVAESSNAGKIGDFAADGKTEAFATVTPGYTIANTAIVEYVAATTASAANATGATSLYSTRDVAYDAWAVAVLVTAKAQVLMDRATLEKARILVLGAEYTNAAASYAAGSQAKVYKDALAADTVLKDAIGVIAATTNSYDPAVVATWTQANIDAVAAAVKTAGKLERVVQLVPAIAAVTMAANTSITGSTLILKAYLEASWVAGAALGREDQATIDKASATTAKEVTLAACTEDLKQRTIEAYKWANLEADKDTKVAAHTVAVAAKSAAELRVSTMKKAATATDAGATTMISTPRVTPAGEASATTALELGNWTEVDERLAFFASVTA